VNSVKMFTRNPRYDCCLPSRKYNIRPRWNQHCYCTLFMDDVNISTCWRGS